MESEEFSSECFCVVDGQTELEDECDEIARLELNEIESETHTCVLIDEENETQVIKTKLRLCRNKCCEGCNNLHLCKLYLFGDCPYNNKREECQFSHDVGSEHNVGVLCQHKLLELDFSELRVTLLQNDDALLPSVCLAYNEGSGEFGNCLEAETCEELHVCENYIRGICDGSTDCRRCHDFYEPHPSKTLQDNGVSGHLMADLLSVYKNMFIIADADRPSIISSDAAPDICLFHFQNSCNLENTCEHVHFNLPYKWEQRDEHSWKVLPDNEETERAFCDPTKIHSDGGEPVHFDSMMMSFAEVRRLSTISSVWDPSFALTTKWIWYWEDECGNWIPYESEEGTHNLSSITNEFLECKYQESSSAVVKFSTAEHSYEINMREMMQYNKESSTKTRVRRRPVFLSAEDVQNIITREIESKDHSENPQALPCDSDKSDRSASGFKRDLLNSNTDEYKKIVERFYQTMSEFTVKSIEKVLNEDLWNVFQRHVNVMKEKNLRKENVKLLFHGTEAKQIDAICKQNIDWRTCEVRETAYGAGSYFTRDAKSSHNYQDKSRTQCMFLCWVSIGDYTNGHPSYIHAPLKDGQNGNFYDSCVNDINNPSTFVVFEKNQMYPAYLIKYEPRAGNSPQHVSPNQLSSSNQAIFSDLSGSSPFFPRYFMPQFQYPTPNFVAPTCHYIPVMRPPFFAYSKQKYFQAGPGQLPFRHYYKPPLVRRFTGGNPTRPPKRQGSHGGCGSLYSPANVFAHPRTPPAISKESKSAKTQDARQQTFRPGGGLCLVNSSGSVSCGTKTSKSDTAQNSRHQGSNSTKSNSGLSASASTSTHTGASQSTKPAGKSSKSSDIQSTKPAGKSSRSSDTQSMKPAGKSSRSSDTQSIKPAGKSSRSSDTESTTSVGTSSKSSASPSTKPAGKSFRSSDTQSTASVRKSSKSSASQSTKPAGKSAKKH